MNKKKEGSENKNKNRQGWMNKSLTHKDWLNCIMFDLFD